MLLVWSKGVTGFNFDGGYPIEQMNREVVRTFCAIPCERRRPVSKWSLAVGTVY